MLGNSLLLWGIFAAAFIFVLALDLGLHRRQKYTLSSVDALVWSIVWVSVALLFSGVVHIYKGPTAFLEYLTAYVVEKSLSLDNIFVFVLIFESFKIPLRYQRRVLIWGIIGALVMRAIMIAFGISLIQNFHFIIYLFGGFLVYTGVHFFLTKETHDDPKKGRIYQAITSFLPVTDHLHGDKFWIKKPYKGPKKIWVATPLFMVLVLVEFTDLIFAVDSIPAVLAISKDPFIVYTSNIFAILGLRALYFLLANAIKKFHYLKVGLSFILCFVGVKMIVASFYKIPTLISLCVILGTILISAIASIAREKNIRKKTG